MPRPRPQPSTPREGRERRLAKAEGDRNRKRRQRAARAAGIELDRDETTRKRMTAELPKQEWGALLHGLSRKLRADELRPEHRGRIIAAAEYIHSEADRIRSSGKRLRDYVICIVAGTQRPTTWPWHKFAALVRDVSKPRDGRAVRVQRAPRGYIAVAVVFANRIVAVAVHVNAILLEPKRKLDAIPNSAMLPIVEW